MLTDAEIAQARDKIPLHELIGRDTNLKRSGAWWIGRCMFHDDSSPSFGVKGDHWVCFAGCGSGGAIDYVMRKRNLGFVEAVAELRDTPAVAPQRRVDLANKPRRRVDAGADDLARVHAIIRESGPVASGTAAWQYLWSRGLPTHQPALRAHAGLYVAETGERLPALVAPIKDSAGHVVATQRIWCLPRVEYGGDTNPKDSRAPLEARKKTLGSMGDGCVRLAAAGPLLGIAEGVETAIACAVIFKIATWAVCGAARFGSVWIPDEVQQLYIFGDRGEAGEALAYRAGALHRQDRECSVVLPDERYGDFAEQLLAREVAA